MVKRVLVTTALEETWPDDEPVLFLGEWCRLHARRQCWTSMDGEVLAYHWDDRQKLFADYQTLQAFYERLLPELAVQLNQIHGVNHGVRYWRILIGPWLNCFTQVLFDRWTTIQQAVSEHDISGAIVLSTSQASYVPNGMVDYGDIVQNDEGNEEIYATILQRFTNISCTVRLRKENTDAVPDCLQVRRGLRDMLVNAYMPAANILSRDSDVVLFMADLSFANAQKLLLYLRQVPQLRRTPEIDRVDADPARRQWRVNGEDRSEFEAAARDLIPRYLPTAYLEGYEKLLEKARCLPWPTRPKLIYTTTGQYGRDVFKAWAAEKTDNGAKLVIGQHGGQYGIGRWVIHEDHDTAIADSFLSWGWSDPENPKVKPVGMLKEKRPLGVQHANQPHALLVTTALPRYSYWLRSIIIGRQWLDSFDDQCAFISALPKDIQNAIIVRLYPHDHGWDQKNRWRDCLPNIKLDEGGESIGDQIAKSRVVISAYNATSYLETLAMDIPTVIYWNPKHWELRASAVPYFEDLKRVGIFHEDPHSATRHVANIWNNVDAWWKSPEVRTVLAHFIEQYSRLPDNLLSIVVKSFQEIAGTNGT